jgi:prepilin-type N-terminal cleavage/methylation domain-containing protein
MFIPPSNHGSKGFTLAEVAVAMAVAAIFAGATFATNQRLLFSLKGQKETTAATMMLQERMESFRGLSYSNLADSSYITTNVAGNATTSEIGLGNLTETITVKGRTLAAGQTAGGADYNQWTRTPPGNATLGNSVANLATTYDLLQVDVLLTWTSANGRPRTRELATIVGKGNIGP